MCWFAGDRVKSGWHISGSTKARCIREMSRMFCTCIQQGSCRPVNQTDLQHCYNSCPCLLFSILVYICQSNNINVLQWNLDLTKSLGTGWIDLMHENVTRPKDSMEVAVTLKSKMAATNASSGGNSKSR